MTTEPATWKWSRNPTRLTELYDLRDAQNKLLAWIEARSAYCDRGHWKGAIEIGCGLDGQDAWPNYYMSLDRGKAEIHAFLMWRLLGVRCNE